MTTSLIVVVLFCCCLGTGRTSDVYVAVNGEDGLACGSDPSVPCATLEGAFAVAKADDVVHIVASGTEKTPYWSCKSNGSLLLTKTVTIQGYMGVAFIGCPLNERSPFLIIGNETSQNMASSTTEHVIFRSLIIQNFEMKIKDTNVTIENCIFFNSSMVVQNKVWQSAFEISGSKWQGFRNCNTTEQCEPVIAMRLMLSNGQAIIKNCTFQQVKSEVNLLAKGSVIVEDSLFTNSPEYTLIHGGLEVNINRSFHNWMRMTRCRFERQVFLNPIQSLMNLYEAPLLIRARENKAATSNVTVVIEYSKFVENERGITMIGPYKGVTIRGCEFRRNIAMHAGAGVLLLTYLTSPTTITDCIFDSNAAGRFRQSEMTEFKESFQVTGDEVRVYSQCCKGVIAFVGKGGAIRLQRGTLRLESSVFVNNTARLLGGAIFVDREMTIDVQDCSFRNSLTYHAMQGDIFYSDGKATVKAVQLWVASALNHVAVLRHSGDHWSIEVTELSIMCPIGHRLRVTNTSAYGVDNYGLKRSYKLDHLSYFCESCPRNKYSLDFGYLNYSLVYTKGAYFTLLINGKKPVAAYNGSYTYHDIKCLDCPYGGKCAFGITAVPNFWGYRVGERVRFQHCPKGYCCASTHCKRYNQCAVNRGGRLCGSCIANYSEALFSSKCVPDSKCDPTWLWPFALTAGIFYALFLLFQKDMRDFIFMQTVRCQNIKISKDYEANHILEDDHPNSPFHENIDTEITNLGSELELESRTENNNTDMKADDEEEEDDAPPPDTGGTFLIILFYYFQDAQLLRVKTVFASAESKSRALIKVVLSGLFKFRLELFQFMDNVCFLKGISPSKKLIIKAVLVPYVIVLFALMYLGYKWILWTRRGNTSHVVEQNHVSANARDDPEEPKKTFLTRLSTGFVLTLLFTYQKLATTTFTLLNCVPVGDDNVLFVEGPVKCYQLWQYGILVYALSCIVPFCVILLIGPGLLKENLISLPQFFFACLFPPPFLFYWFILRWRLRAKSRPAEATHQLSLESQSVINVLQGPFKDIESKTFGSLCGAGILIGRRLVLVLLFTFVNDTLIRLLCMMLVCFIILLHHVHAQPYKDLRGNIAGSASASALLITGGINLVRSAFEAAEYVPQGPNEILMIVFEEIENVLMLWFPMGVMCLVFIALSVKIGGVVFKCCASAEVPAHRAEQNTECTRL